jgi:hypothetical protein
MRDDWHPRPLGSYRGFPGPFSDHQRSMKIGGLGIECSPQAKTRPLRPPKRPQLHLGPLVVGRRELPGWPDATQLRYTNDLDPTLP